MDINHKDIARTYKAFCDENRIRILDILRDGEHCACDLLDKMQISQSTLSHHMKILVDAEIVKGRKDGKWMHYSISHEGMLKANQYLSLFSSEKVCKNHNNNCYICK